MNQAESPALPSTPQIIPQSGAERGTRFAIRVNPKLREEVEAALAKDTAGRYAAKASGDVVFSDGAPEVLRMLGMKNARIYTKAFILRKIERKHGISADMMPELVSAVGSPAAVFGDVGGSFVVLTDVEAKDLNGEFAPVMVWIRPDTKGNYVASAYSRTAAGEAKYVNLLNGGRMLYLDKEKAANLKLRGEAKSSFESFSGGGLIKTPEDISSFVSAESIPQSDAERGTRFAIRVNPKLREDVEAVLAKRSDAAGVRQMKRHAEIVFSEDLPLFEFLGLPSRRVVSDATRIRKLAAKHHLDEAQIADLPKRCDSPAAVMRDGADGYVVLTDMLAETDDGERKPVRVFLRPKTWRSGEVVFLATAMAENGADERAYYEPLVKSGLLYADQGKIAGLMLGEETESILRTQASGDGVKTAEEYSAWASRSESIPQSDAERTAESVARNSIRAALADGGEGEAERALANYVAYFKLSHGGTPARKTLARMGLAALLAGAYAGRDAQWSASLGVKLRAGCWDAFFEGLKALYAKLPYGSHERFERKHEASYARPLCMLLAAQGFQYDPEAAQTEGRSDLVATHPCGTYIFELKVGGTAADALQQIRERGYAKPYLAQGLPIWAIGLAFDAKTRQLVDADVEKIQ